IPGGRAVRRGAAGGLIAAACPAAARRALAAEAVVTEIRDRFAVVSGAGGNALVRHGDGGQVLVDTGAAEHAESLRAALDRLPGAGRVGTVFNTHWHLDQVGSNGAFGRSGASIVAHEKTRHRLAVGYYLPDEDRHREPVPPESLPTETFHERGETVVDGERI